MYFDQSGLVMVSSNSSEMVSMNHPMNGVVSEYVQTQCVLADGGDRFGVCALTFDKQEELLWMGNQGGHVTSYYTGALQKYTSFQVHATNDIRQIITIGDGILVLSANSLRYQMRRGIPIFTHGSSNMTNLQCMLHLASDRLLLGGQQDTLVEFNLEKCRETNVIDAGDDTGYVMFRVHSKCVCAATPLGRIDLRDSNNLNVVHTLQTHSGNLSDFDIQGNLLVTCGFSNRHGNLSVDRFLKVYDLRMLKAVSPIPTVVDPLYLRFMPSVSSRLVVVSGMGQIQLLDTIALTEPRVSLLQFDNPGGALCLGFDISSTSQAMAFGDSAGSIHLFSATPEPIFNTFSRMTEHADPVTPLHSFAIDDYNTPLSSVPMPKVPPGVPLASDWPAHLLVKKYRKPPGISPEILQTMKMQGPIGYAPNPRTTRRNQVMYDIEKNGNIRALQSEKRSPGRQEEGINFIAIPKRYRKIDLRYSKLGTDDFQFEQFNKTGLPGLEATLPNAYCNSMIQVLYYTEPLRACLLSHLCTKEFCLSCELSFLFHMLCTAQGQPCQPGNFLRAFRTVPEASALGLILSDLHPDTKSKVDLSGLIQSWNRFMLHQIHVELVENKKRKEERSNTAKPFVYKETDFPTITGYEKKKVCEVNTKFEEEKREEESEISQLFGTKQLQVNRCLKCNNEEGKESILLVCNLVYPTNEPEKEEWSFCDILLRSLCPQQTTPAWCDSCGKFTPTTQSRVLQSLPKLLAINTGLQNPQHKLFWQSQMDNIVAKVTSDCSNKMVPAMANISSSKPCRYGDNCSRPGCRFRHSFDNVTPQAPMNNPYCSNNWLPHEIQMELKDQKLAINKVEDSNEDEVKAKENCSIYELTSVVCYINDQSSQEKKNLVALIKVPDSYFINNADKSEHKWYLFNDFSICPVPVQEAVWFSLDWKTPCVLYYAVKEIAHNKSPIYASLTKEVFTQDASIARSGPKSSITFTPLAEAEMPKPGDLIPMDAEFVTLNQEESEIRSDGKMSTVKPSQMSVARITCLRGQGPIEGTPFIDDYISTQEQVVDYLTKFSGIKPGDLDANFSSKHLTTLKSTYVKLRFLQDSGVIFVGHGLKNDFRVINLVVPPEQVVDTVYLFHLPHHRWISLRFLAWHFLGLKIQSETHDSVEDARTALHLYKKYKELETQNRVREALMELYETGKLLNWKVPDE